MNTYYNERKPFCPSWCKHYFNCTMQCENEETVLKKKKKYLTGRAFLLKKKNTKP